MLEKTHRRIAKEIAKELNLGEREAGLLEAGSVNPDSWADFPHHYGKDDEIMGNVLDARRLFLQADDECYYRLGIALHYIADRWTMRPRMKDKHTGWEMKIDRAPTLNDSELIKSIKQAPLPTKAEQAYLTFLEKISKGATGMTTAECDIISKCEQVHITRVPMPKHIRGLGKKVVAYALQGRPTTWSNPIFDMNFSYRICLEVARKVFSREHDKGEWYDVEAERHDAEIATREHEKRMKEAEERQKEASTIFWMLMLLTFISYVAGFASTSAGSPLLGVFLIIFGLICTILALALHLHLSSEFN